MGEWPGNVGRRVLTARFRCVHGARCPAGQRGGPRASGAAGGRDTGTVRAALPPRGPVGSGYCPHRRGRDRSAAFGRRGEWPRRAGRARRRGRRAQPCRSLGRRPGQPDGRGGLRPSHVPRARGTRRAGSGPVLARSERRQPASFSDHRCDGAGPSPARLPAQFRLCAGRARQVRRRPAANRGSPDSPARRRHLPGQARRRPAEPEDIRGRAPAQQPDRHGANRAPGPVRRSGRLTAADRDYRDGLGAPDVHHQFRQRGAGRGPGPAAAVR